MDASWVPIGIVFVVTVGIALILSLIFSRRAGAGILFPHRSGRGRKGKDCSHQLRLGDDWYARGEHLVAAGMYREALAAYERAYALENNGPGMLYCRGRIFYDMGMYDQAWGQVSHALAEDSRHAAAWILKGDLLCKKGDLANARSCYRMAFYLQGQDKARIPPEYWDELPDDPISDKW
ncbi:tetratricopeptide (TPR) repeat protein [Methanolinea mesophila]|uniref:tetratricopeptide repeat protein n=1 Tax=Methanolinea mesophila TaxID=547055 RepID=UPI001AE944F8|nr:tetratricopeptide repeat protein [Methanolinea mesophila]MBP1928510.1 tetratricopeptide (TPR) repeat protein [Methanolinea mesophila]